MSDINRFVGLNGLAKFSPPTMNNIKTQLNNCMNTYTYYWLNTAMATVSEHILIKIINSCSVMRLSGNPKSLYYELNAYANRIASSLDMVSARQYGSVSSTPWFFNSPNKEIYVSVKFKETQELITNLDTWQAWNPVRFAYHPFSDFSYQPPIGVKDKWRDKRELPIIIFIDITLLMFQYIMWIETEMKKESIDISTIGKFLIRHPLKNSIESYIDVSFMNRVLNSFSNRKSDDIPMSNQYYSPVSYKLINTAASYIANKFSTNVKNIDTLLASIPLIYRDNMTDYSYPIDDGITRTNILGLFIPTIPIYEFMADCDYSNPQSGFKQSNIITMVRKFHKHASNNGEYSTISGLYVKEISTYVQNNIIDRFN